MYICFSRFHEREKKGKSSRPKFHVYFVIDPITNQQEYTALKQRMLRQFPHLHFDGGAKDAARFFFGVENPQVLMIGGDGN